MLGLLTISRLVFKTTPPGLAYTAFKNALRTVDALVQASRSAKMQKDEEHGLNREEEKHHENLYGGTEPFFPFRLSLSDFPENMEKLVGEDFSGEFVWKLSEWNELAHWFSVLLQNALHGTHHKVGRDGRWLLEVGRRRWKEKEWRAKAHSSVSKHPEVVSEFDFIVRQREG